MQAQLNPVSAKRVKPRPETIRKQGWLDNAAVSRKLGLIALVLGVPIFALSGIIIKERWDKAESTKQELYGLQKTAPLSEISSGIYLYADAYLQGNKKNIKSGIERATINVEALKPQLSNRSLNSLITLEVKWKEMSDLDHPKTDYELIKIYEDIIQNHQQKIVEEMLSDAGLSSDPDKLTSATIMANQRTLPKIAGGLQLATVSARAMIRNPHDLSIRDQVRRDLILASNDIASYERDLKRAYALDPLLESEVGNTNQKMINISSKTVASLLQSVSSGKITQLQINNIYASLNALRESYIATITSLAHRLIDRTKAAYINMALQILGLLIIIIAATLLLRAITQRITRPLKSLTDASTGLISGNLNIKVETHSKDELGFLADSFNLAIAQLRENAQRVEEERIESQNLQHNISEFLDVTMDIAEGDFTKRGKVTENILGNVVDSINLMTSELAETLQGVLNASKSIDKGSQDMFSATQQIHQGTLVTTKESLRVARQAKEVNAGIRQMSAIAQASAESARRAQYASEQGQEAVQSTLNGMQNIRLSSQNVAEHVTSLAQRSEQIQAITDSMGHIASQVSLLSLHASIEAAGAGAAGSRFGIVAEEVRLLADLSTEETQRIAHIISQIQKEIKEVVKSMSTSSIEIENGHKVAKEASLHLKEISELTEISVHFANNISLATQTQVKGVQDMSTAVQSIAAIAGEAQEFVNQGRHTAEQLEQLSVDLNTRLARFRLS